MQRYYVHGLDLRRRLRHHALVFARLDVVDRALKVPPRVVERRRRLGAVQVRVDQLDEPVDEAHRDGLVLLLEVVQVSV
jgi:hypothetical protein